MADIFPDRLKQSFDAITELHPNKVAVDEDHKFIGFDAYEKLIASENQFPSMEFRRIQ